MLPVLMVFAKAPRPGHVKTRLVPPLTSAQAATLHEAFVRDTLRRFQTLPEFSLELHTDIETDAWTDLKVPRRLQHEGDLGLKMFKALEGALRRGAPQALILGSDSPTLPVDYVDGLVRAQADIAFGPTTDGGFYAVAVKRTYPEMFNSVRWSTPDALGDSLAACAAAGLTTSLGLEWFDIDCASDLDRLRPFESLPVHTRQVLTGLFVSRGQKSA